MYFSFIKFRQKGAVAIEFAFLLPILLVLLVGIIEFSIMFYDKAMLTNACREGARLGIVYNFDPTVTDIHPTDGEITATVQAYCQNHLISFGNSSQLQTQITRTGDEHGDPLTVTVAYHYEFLVLPNFITALAGGLDLGAESVMRME
ncbi:MAG: pilus assembly protein [Syntrophales bacterium]|jgi:Flp pilus assembly protein TadG|nr:pilus assembly protein [Syntrophales bacterium]MDY0043615.1 pilus assembly protein [Syntrophales bacterium]